MKNGSAFTTGSWILNGGTVRSGTIKTNDGSSLLIKSGVLDGVTLGSEVVVPSQSNPTVRKGLRLDQAALALVNSGTSPVVYFSGTQAVTGNGQIVFAGSPGTSYLYSRGDGGGNPATLTIGPGGPSGGHRHRRHDRADSRQRSDLLWNRDPGVISVAGELDEWTFFGRSDQTVTVLINPGSGGANPPAAPYLGHVEVRLLDQQGNVLAAASNGSFGAVASLNDVRLPADGTYRIQVHASAAQTASIGNYTITPWNVTADVAPLTFNQPTHGAIETPFRVDRWTFSAVAGQQVRFDWINATSAGIAFDLTGPGGWTGFDDVTADYSLLTLPTSGAFVVSAHGLAGAMGEYAFPCWLWTAK